MAKNKKVLVTMTKEGEEPIKVSPLVVENHKQLGWSVVDEKPAAVEAAGSEGAEKKAEATSQEPKSAGEKK